MAFCSACNAVMSAMEVRCPHCGYLPPATDPNVRRSGIAHSSLADFALVVSTIATTFSCLLTLYFSLITLSAGQLFNGLVLCPIAFLVQLGLVVVFLRIQEV